MSRSLCFIETNSIATIYAYTFMFFQQFCA